MPQAQRNLYFHKSLKKYLLYLGTWSTVVCKNSRLSSLLTAKDVSPEGISAPRRQKFHNDEDNLSGIWSGALIGQHSSYIVLAFVDDRQTTDKEAQRSRVNVMNLLQKSQYSWNIFFFGASVINRRTQNFTIIDQEKHKIQPIYIWSPMTTGLIMSKLIYVISKEFPLLRHKRPSW